MPSRELGKRPWQLQVSQTWLLSADTYIARGEFDNMFRFCCVCDRANAQITWKKKQIWNSNLNAALCLKNAINYFIFAPTGTNLMSMYSWFTQSHVHIFVFYIIFFCLFVFDISRKFRQLVTDKWTLWNSKNELKRIHRNAMMCPK